MIFTADLKLSCVVDVSCQEAWLHHLHITLSNVLAIAVTIQWFSFTDPITGTSDTSDH